MQHKLGVTRTIMATVCTSLACAQSMQAGFISTSLQWTGGLWSWEPAKIVRYTATGAAAGATIVGSYFAYNSGVKGNVTKVFWGAILGGGCGLLLSQMYGVRAGVRKIEKIVEELRGKLDTLTTNVRDGFVSVQNQLAQISQSLGKCVTFEALERVKYELMVFIHGQAQIQKNDTKCQLKDIEQRLQEVVSSDHEALGRIEAMLKKLLTKNQQPVIVNVSSTSTNCTGTTVRGTCSNENSNNTVLNNTNNNDNHTKNQQNNSMSHRQHNKTVQNNSRGKNKNYNNGYVE